MKPKMLDTPRARLRGAGVRQNMRNTRRAIAQKRRAAAERDLKEWRY